MDEIEKFLRERNVPEEQISNLKHDKIDCHVILEMSDQDLSEYLPLYGDRLALKKFCRGQTGENSTSLKRKDLLSKLREKIRPNRRADKNDSDDGGETAAKNSRRSNHGNTSASRKLRRVELVWMNWDELTKSYKQVRAPTGGGVRHLTIEKTISMADLLEISKELFFPGGKSPRGDLIGFRTTFRCVDNTIMQLESTVEEHYDRTKMRLLRFHFCTEPASSLENDEEADNQAVTVPSDDGVVMGSSIANLHDVASNLIQISLHDLQATIETVRDKPLGDLDLPDLPDITVPVRTTGHGNTPLLEETSTNAAISSSYGPNTTPVFSDGDPPKDSDSSIEASLTDDEFSNTVLHTDTGTPTVIFNRYPKLNEAERQTIARQALDDEDDNDDDLQRALHASIVHELPSPNLDTILKKWVNSNLRDADVLDIIIQRRRILESTERAMSRPGFTCYRPVYVRFSGECGEDQGGPKREFFRLLMKCIQDTVLDGETGNMSFQHDLQKLEKQKYFSAGRCIGWSLLQGGPGLPCLNKTLYQFIAEDTTNIKLDADDVFDAETRRNIIKIRDANDADDADICDWVIDQGLPPLINMTQEKRKKIVHLAVKNYIYYRTHAEIDQFQQGLNAVGELADVIKNNVHEMASLFTKQHEELTSLRFKSILQINFSPEGSSKRPMEEDTVYAFELFLQDCTEDGAVVQLRDLLCFWTGAEEIPPLGFPKTLELDFVDNNQQLPVAHTCNMSLEVSRGIEDPEDFKRKMTMAIQWTDGFHIA